MIEALDGESDRKMISRWAVSRAGKRRIFQNLPALVWRSVASVACLCLLAAALQIVPPAYAEGAKQQSPGAVPVPSMKPKANTEVAQPDESTNLFLKHAADAGVSACAGVYASLGKALTNGNPFMLQTQSAKENANVHSLQGVVGMSYRSETGYDGLASGLVFAAPVGNSCEGHMVRVVPVPESCQTITGRLPQGSTPLPVLGGIPIYALPGDGQAMLVPAGTGCIAISIARLGG